MAAKTKSKPKSKKQEEPEPDVVELEAPPVPTFEERYLSRIFRPNLLLAAALLGTGFVLAPAALKVIPNLAQRAEYRIRTTDIQIPEPPRWVPAGFLNQIIKKADLPDEVSVLDRELAGELGRAFESNPWISGPVQVRIKIPARIEVSFEYRQPTAMVRINDGYYPIDGEGLLLPPQDFPSSEVARFPRIVGVGAPPVGSVGQSWGDERVLGAARLAAVVGPYWDEFQLDTIEVPKRETAEQKYDELQYALTAKGGSRIIWGRAPGAGHPLEITDDQKIGRIKEFLSKGKSFDGPWEVNINHLMEIGVRPLEVPKVVKPAPTPVRKRRNS